MTFKSTLKYFSHILKSAGSWMIAGGLFQAASGFGANIVLARNLEISDFGQYAVIHSIIGLTALLINSCVGTLIINTKDSSFDKNYKNKLHSVFILECILLVCLASFGSSLFGQLNFNTTVLLIGTIIMGWTDFQMKFIERRKQFKNVAVIETWSEIISHILSVIGLLVGFGAIVLYARFLLKGFLKILFLKLYGTTLNMQFGRITLNWLYNYLYSVRLFYFNGMLESGLERLTILFLGAFSGVKETGYFFQARRLAGVPHQILHPYFTRMLFNTFSRNDSFQLAFRTLNKNMFILLIILTIALFLTFTIGRDVIVFIFGVKWEPVITIVYALSGVIATITPFELLKVFCQAKSENMSMFLYIGRGTQYFFFVTAALVAILLGDHYVVILSAGISAGYLLGSIVLYISLYKIQSDLKLENTKF